MKHLVLLLTLGACACSQKTSPLSCSLQVSWKVTDIETVEGPPFEGLHIEHHSISSSGGEYGGGRSQLSASWGDGRSIRLQDGLYDLTTWRLPWPRQEPLRDRRYLEARVSGPDDSWCDVKGGGAILAADYSWEGVTFTAEGEPVIAGDLLWEDSFRMWLDPVDSAYLCGEQLPAMEAIVHIRAEAANVESQCFRAGGD